MLPDSSPMLAVVANFNLAHQLSSLTIARRLNQALEKIAFSSGNPACQHTTEKYLKILNHNFQTKQMQWATLTSKTVDTQWAHTNTA